MGNLLFRVSSMLSHVQSGPHCDLNSTCSRMLCFRCQLLLAAYRVRPILIRPPR